MFFDYIDDNNNLATIANVTSVVPVQNGSYLLVKSSSEGNQTIRQSKFVEVRPT